MPTEKEQGEFSETLVTLGSTSPFAKVCFLLSVINEVVKRLRVARLRIGINQVLRQVYCDLVETDEKAAMASTGTSSTDHEPRVYPIYGFPHQRSIFEKIDEGTGRRLLVFEYLCSFCKFSTCSETMPRRKGAISRMKLLLKYFQYWYGFMAAHT